MKLSSRIGRFVVFAVIVFTKAATASAAEAQWPLNISFTEIVNAKGETIIAVHDGDNVKAAWGDVDALIAQMTGQSEALISPEYLCYREGASALLGPAVYTTDSNADYDSIAKVKSTPEHPWLSLIQPKTQADFNCLTISIVGGKPQGCGDVFQNGLTDDKLGCFQGQTYLKCHLECMGSEYTPGRCTESN